ncbi:unnamed protein product [Somion occarium]|uniref:Uncharacterized protein n=1 Tax=Somion occarium TaxID=3059160 RepID=A0ABP1E7L7_9APHY
MYILFETRLFQKVLYKMTTGFAYILELWGFPTNGNLVLAENTAKSCIHISHTTEPFHEDVIHLLNAER